jgi:hypothetical protein
MAQKCNKNSSREQTRHGNAKNSNAITAIMSVGL